MKSGMIIHPDELSGQWIDQMVEAKVDVLGIHSVGGHRAAGALKELLVTVQTAEYRSLIDYARARGLTVEYELHAAGYLMPRELFDEHPEYFRVNAEGERIADRNFCVSNPDALELFADRAADLACALYGSSHNFYFWLDDGHDLHCHCPECQKLSPSDQQMIALNAMLRKIRKRIPDARMAYLAYMDSIVPPTVSAEDGIFLEYAPFEKYTAKGKNAPALIKREREMLLPLMKLFDREPKKLLEYWYDNSLYSKWKKPPVKFDLDEATMRTEIAEYRSLGFDEIATFACFLGPDYRELHGDVDVRPFVDCVNE